MQVGTGQMGIQMTGQVFDFQFQTTVDCLLHFWLFPAFGSVSELQFLCGEQQADVLK